MATPTTTVTIVIHGPMVDIELGETMKQRAETYFFGGVPTDRVGYPGARRRLGECRFGVLAGWNVNPPAIDNSGSRYSNRMQVYARDMDHFVQLQAALRSAHAALHNVDDVQPVGQGIET